MVESCGKISDKTCIYEIMCKIYVRDKSLVETRINVKLCVKFSFKHEEKHT